MHGHGHHQAMPMSPPSVQLPRTLSRPHFAEASRDLITAVAPELANVPPEYIRRGLRAKAPQYVSSVIISFQFTKAAFRVECSQASPVCRHHIYPLRCQNRKCPRFFRFQFVHRRRSPPIQLTSWPLHRQSLHQMSMLCFSRFTASPLLPNAQHCLDCPLRADHLVGAFTFLCYPSISLLLPHLK